MKKILGIALALALMASLCFGSVALAGDPQGVYTEWEFDGEGEIEINTEDKGLVGGSDHLYVESYGSGSSGWQDVSYSTTPSYTDALGGRTEINRHVYVEDGSIDTYTHRVNSSPAFPVDTEYWSGLDVSSGGTLDQYIRNTKDWGVCQTTIVADGSYNMWSGVTGECDEHPYVDHCYFFFVIGADGNGSGVLNLSAYDQKGTLVGPTTFHVSADSSAGFYAEWENSGVLGGHMETDQYSSDFDFDVHPGTGTCSGGASGAWVIIDGFVKNIK